MNDPLEGLRGRFRERLTSDRARLDTLVHDDPTGDEFRGLVHGLAGAAGMFGYPLISQAAIAVDDQLAEGLLPDPDSVQRLRARLAEIDGSAS